MTIWNRKFWGMILENLGVAPPSLPLRLITSEEFLDSVSQLAMPEIKAAALAFETKLNKENGMIQLPPNQIQLSSHLVTFTLGSAAVVERMLHLMESGNAFTPKDLSSSAS